MASPWAFTRSLVRFLALALAWLVGALAVAWAAGALYLDLPASPPVRSGAAVAWALVTVALEAFGGWRGKLALLAGFVGVAAWWSTLRPRQDRDWAPQVAVLAYATREGDQVTVHNVRNFEYRSATNFTPRYEVRTYDLGALRALDLFINYWGSSLMAHPILSFDFGPQGHLCFSIEVRPERGEGYSMLGGLYRKYELIYVAADERDAVRLRTNFNGEDVYLYRLTIPPQAARTRFMEYIHRLNQLHERPAWYNAVTANCTTSIRAQRAAADRARWDWRILVNGYADRMLYEHHALAGALPCPDLKARACINQRARAAGDAPDFSARIRAGAPGFEGT